VSHMFVHRLSGIRVDQLPTQIGYGLWTQISSPASDARLSPWVERGDYVVPGMWRRSADQGDSGGLQSSRVAVDTIPPRDLRRAAASYAGLAVEGGCSWESWQSYPLLSVSKDQEYELGSMEACLETGGLRQLNYVCRAPRERLKDVLEVEPVSRARRLASNASEYLASHPEDWEGRRLQGVVPRRVLSKRLYDDLDIYENRVAARFLDEARRVLQRRRAELRRRSRALRSALEFSDNTMGIYWQKRERICALWGDAVRGQLLERAVHAERLLARVEQLYRHMSALVQSRLYKGVSPRAQVPRRLRSSNIFRDDASYRKVYDLWEALCSDQETAGGKGEVKYAEHQEACLGYEAFVIAGLLRVFDSDGWSLKSGQAPRRGGEAVLCRETDTILLAWSADGTIRLTGAALEERMTVVPVFSHGGGNWRPDPDLEADPRSGGLVVCQLPRLEGTPGPELGDPRKTCQIAMSPLDIESVERLGCVVRASLLRTRLQSCQPALSLSRLESNFAQTLIPKALIAVHDLRLRRPLEEHERFILAEAADPRAPAVRDAVRKAELSFHEALQCPVCSDRASSEGLRSADNGYWVAECAECGTKWGIKICGRCRERVPFVRPTIPPAAKWLADGTDGARIFGQDLLGDPCWEGRESTAVICRLCGVCPNAGKEVGRGCGRCGHSLGARQRPNVSSNRVTR
jgi:hypothetical protein